MTMAVNKVMIPGAAGKPDVAVDDPAVDYPLHDSQAIPRDGYKGPLEPTRYEGAEKIPAAGTGDVPVGPVKQFKKGK